MFCPYCGAQADDQSKFCFKCGAKLPQRGAPAAPEAPVVPQSSAAPPTYPAPSAYTPPRQPAAVPVSVRRPRKKLPDLGTIRQKLTPKMMGVIAAAVILVVTLAVILGALGSSPAYITAKGDLTTVYQPESDETCFLSKGKLLDLRFDGNYSSAVCSMDGTVLALESEDDILYVCDGKTLTAVAEDVGSWLLSRDGDSICYLDSDDSLILYNVKKDKAVTIAQDCTYQYAVSPNGKQVIYVTDENPGVLMYFNGRKSVEIEKNAIPLALSDSGKYIYYRHRENDGLYVTNARGNTSKLCSEVESECYLNADATQILFCSDDKLFVSVKGGDKIRIYSDVSMYSFYPLTPQDSGRRVQCGRNTLIMPLESFGEQCYWNFYEEKIIYLNKKWERETLADEVERVQLCSDGKTLVYTNSDDELIRLNIQKPEKAETLAEDVSSFQVTADGKGLYYVDYDETLWFTKGGKAKRIADDVHSMVISQDNRLYFLTDYSYDCGELYVSKNGGKRTKIASDVYMVSSTNFCTYVAMEYESSDDTFDLYTVSGGTKLNLILEGVG